MTPHLAMAITPAHAAMAAHCAAYLTSEERRACAGQRLLSRRAQSTCARVAAKWLRLETDAGRSAPLVALDAASLADHPRERYLACALSAPGRHPPRFDDAALAVSLTHTGDLAAAAVTRAGAVGVDIERIEDRAASFADEHFTPREREDLARHAGQGADQPTLDTFLWSAKEALYKTGALPLPAQFSFRDLEIALTPDTAPFARPCVRAFTLTACGAPFFGWAVLTGTFALVAVVAAPPAAALKRAALTLHED
ncbi:4'-phosphopantetheinyl transferase family protein [Chondromyces apiculatus]|uniref:4'-phosphopantetheinyl transferase family protein n=1 Tax=Chondromyces apiculatus DSM 436 TaxID=1192034 RepID=A0A017TB95_9BACT|nr:4'-phosphopantetheinyl transferase superfamily protein [Chondromyces apiculatus]EYF06075.1 4'-phosphopantetheinyl transferase family protein [Chondromyces apiculatus DSM 436]